MISNKKYNGENIYTIVIITVLAFALIILIYSIFSSNSNLYKNSNNSASSNNNSTNNNTNQNNISQEEIDKMNVNTNTVQENSPPTTKTKETLITSYTTTIYDKDENRVYNIGLANEKLNNFIVKTGEEFSFNNTIGPMGEKQGFKKALGFDSEGRKIQTFGGGLCQISSTLYNCVLIANLEVTERHPHSRRVYYVPKDKDATIYYGLLDLKFKNNTANDIKILSKNDAYNVTVELYKIEVQ